MGMVNNISPKLEQMYEDAGYCDSDVLEFGEEVLAECIKICEQDAANRIRQHFGMPIKQPSPTLTNYLSKKPPREL